MPSTPASERGRVAGNVGVLVASELAVKIFTLAFYAVLARRLGVTAFGQWTYAFTIASLFLSVFHFGLGNLYTRDAARPGGDESRLASQFFSVRVLLSGGGLALLVAVAWIARGSASPATVLALGGAVTLAAIGDQLRAIFRARQVMRRDALLTLLERASTSVAGLACVWWRGTVEAVAVGWLAATAFSLVVGWEMVRRAGVRLSLRLRDPAVRRILRQALPLCAMGVFGQIYFREDILLLRWLGSEADVGVYASAYRIFDMFIFLPGVLATAYLPAASAALGRRDLPALRDLAERTLGATFVLSVPLALAFSLRADDVVAVLFGPAYAASVTATRVVVWTMLFYFANWTLAHSLLAAHRLAWSAWCVVGGTVVNAALNLWLIPWGGPVGSAWATLVTEAALFAVQWALVTRGVVGLSVRRVVGRPLIVAAAVAATLAVSMRAPWPVAATGVLVVYAMSVHLLGLANLRRAGERMWAITRG